MNYREDITYQMLERIIELAGVSIEYGHVPDDSIDGEIWARSDQELCAILMPDDGDAFPDIDTACIKLGHEMGHILTTLKSVDGDPTIRAINEQTCDLIGAYLYRLAEMIADHAREIAAEKAWKKQQEQSSN